MHVWLDLISRELLFLALLTLLGLAPAAWLLPERFDRGSRLTLAPVLGLSLGLCLTVTALYAFPARDTGLPLALLAVASGAVGLARLGVPGPRPGLRSLAQLGLVAVIVIVSFNYPLAARHSVGPIGGYRIGDTSGYVTEIATVNRYSLHQIDRVHGYTADLDVRAWAIYAQHDQQLDVAPLQANVNSLLGLGPTDTQSAFLIAIILTGALGAFSVVRALAGPRTWAPAFAGVLFAGPLFAELLMDGSEAAITGSALLAPLVVVGYEAVTRPRWRTLALFALMAAALQTAYPLYVPVVVIAGAVTVIVAAAARRRRGRVDGREVTLAAAKLAVVLALSAALTPIAFVRNVHYWLGLLKGSYTMTLSNLPAYHLPADVLPGWLLQTREFYGLVSISRATAGVLIGAAVVPALLVGLIVLGALRHRVALVMAAVAVAAFGLAEYAAAVQHCSYCVQRNLLPAASLVPTALGLGLASVAAVRWRGAGIAAALIALLALVLIGNQGIVERRRLEQGAYVLDPQLRQTAARIPAQSGPVELEGFGEGTIQAPMELPLAYNLVDRITSGNVSLPTITDDGSGLAYLAGPAPLGPSFKANYQYVLTRLGSIATRRRTVARFGPIALQRRIAGLDVTLLGGVSVGTVRADPTGTAWVTGPLAFLVAGGQAHQPAWISLTFQRSVAVHVIPNPALVSSRVSGETLKVCLRAVGLPPVRTAGAHVAFTPQAPPPPVGYAPPLPTRGLRLTAMRVSTISCRGAR